MVQNKLHIESLLIQLLIDYTHIYIWKEKFPESIFQIITTSEFGYLAGNFINLFIIHSEYLHPDFSPNLSR